MSGFIRHMDCRNFAAVDVAKGICHRTKDLVPADAFHCEHFVPLQKCRFCIHFAAGDQYVGICTAVSTKPMTYPDLITVTCEMFVAANVARA
jgi:4-hydroxyphenylacetate decarboxylase small subunit